MAVLCGLLLVTASCSGGDDSGGASDAAATEVRPFREVQDSDFVFEADPAGPDARDLPGRDE